MTQSRLSSHALASNIRRVIFRHSKRAIKTPTSVKVARLNHLWTEAGGVNDNKATKCVLLRAPFTTNKLNFGFFLFSPEETEKVRRLLLFTRK